MGNSLERLSVLVLWVIIVMILMVALYEWGADAPLSQSQPAATISSSKGEESELVSPPEGALAPLVEYKSVTKMPKEYIIPRQVTVRDLAVGQGGWIFSAALYVIEETHEVWVSPNELVGAERNLFRDIFIGRGTDGLYVDISSLPVEERRWEMDPRERMPSDYLRVARLIDGKKPEAAGAK